VALDFAMARPDVAVCDVAKVHLQIGLLSAKPQYRTRDIRQLQDALLAGFDPKLSDRDPLFRLIMLLHRINHLAGLYLNRSNRLAAIYNMVVRRQHLGWLAGELAAPAPSGFAR
jgi:hypothetical protein